MGYGFCCSKRKDTDSIFYSSCMYAYQEIFKECFGREISKFSGKVTNVKSAEFRSGVDKFANNPKLYNVDYKQMRGYIDNCKYEDLVKDLYTICDMMDSKEIGYLNIA